MSAAAIGSGSSATLTIGDVLAHLKVDFPDLTISKIRFLETEGLVEPQRTPSGYRKFAPGDVARLKYVLAQQRDHYLPLRVIKEQLDAIDRGLVPPGTSTDSPRPAHVAVATIADNAPTAEHFRPSPAAMRMSRDELLNAAGLRSEQLSELEQFGLINAKPGATTTTMPSRWPRSSRTSPGSVSRVGICARSAPRPSARSGCSPRS